MMAESPDFILSFKNMFKLKHLGLRQTQPKTDISWAFSPKKFVVHYEIDAIDADKKEDIISYFNRNSSRVDDNFFGTPMSACSIYTPYLDDEEKLRISKHAKKQLLIGNNIQSISISGIQILNWADKDKQFTLHRELMQIESITEKK